MSRTAWGISRPACTTVRTVRRQVSLERLPITSSHRRRRPARVGAFTPQGNAARGAARARPYRTRRVVLRHQRDHRPRGLPRMRAAIVRSERLSGSSTETTITLGMSVYARVNAPAPNSASSMTSTSRSCFSACRSHSIASGYLSTMRILDLTWRWLGRAATALATGRRPGPSPARPVRSAEYANSR